MKEINRIITDHVSELLFCPSNHSKKILSYEGINKGVYVVGDVMYDIFKKNKHKINQNSNDDKYALLTLHRAENTTVNNLKIRLNQISTLKSVKSDVI